MKASCLLVLCVAMLLSGCSALSRSDIESLQGTWAGSLKDQSEIEVTLAVAGHKAEFDVPSADEWYVLTVTLNERAAPKELDFAIEDCSHPDSVGLVAKAIYEIDGDTLTIAAGEPGDEWRPTHFEGEDDGNVFIFTRQQP